jgi:hypothetical protein
MEQHDTLATPAAGAPDTLPRLPFARPGLLAIAPLYRRLQAERPITPVRPPAGEVAWLVTRYADVKALLSDERLGRSHPDPARAARISGSALLGGPTGDYATEQADHARMRRALTPGFSGKRMEALSFPLPVLVIYELLGVPYADRGALPGLVGRDGQPPRPRDGSGRPARARRLHARLDPGKAPGAGGGCPLRPNRRHRRTGGVERAGDHRLRRGLALRRPRDDGDPDRLRYAPAAGTSRGPRGLAGPAGAHAGHRGGTPPAGGAEQRRRP